VAVRASESRRLEAAIAALPGAFREVLILREMEDMSYQQIAETVHAPIGTVMSRLARARALLRDQWLAEAPHVVR
jgi:RNA polymerase sigma-70 factor (ECF subfamily)